MRGTVGQRIAIGYAVLLLLLVAVAVVGMYTLSSTAETSRVAIREQGERLGGVLRQRKAVSAAHSSILAFLLGPGKESPRDWRNDVAQARQILSQLRDTSPTPEVRAAWEGALRVLDAYQEAGETAVAAKMAGRDADALGALVGRVLSLRDQVSDEVDRAFEPERTRITAVTQAAVIETTRAFWVMLVVSALAVVLGILIAWRLAGFIILPLRETIGTLASASSEILAATSQQAAGTAEEATAVQETSTTVEEVKQTVQVAAQKARATAEAAQRAAQVSQDGRRAVEETIRGMQETKVRMEGIAERILALSEQGQAIGDIIATVNDLAEQSNILAVNASIEAAKAGEAGKGFAVVAAEVKSLAEQSKQATTQVRRILQEVQRATQAAVMAAEQGVKASEAGAGVAAKAGDAIRLLAESLADTAQAAQHILVSAQQQAAGMDQVALAMKDIQQASTQNMASTRQVERAAHSLNESAGRLKTLVATPANGRLLRARAD